MIFSIEGLPHPGREGVLKYLASKMRGTVPLIQHQCIADRGVSASYPILLSTLRNVQQLKRMGSEKHVLMGRPFVDGSHIPIVAQVHLDVYDELLNRLDTTNSYIFVHLRCDPHDCFERLSTIPPSHMVSLDDVFVTQQLIQATIKARGNHAIELECPAFFDDSDALVERISSCAHQYLLKHVSYKPPG